MIKNPMPMLRATGVPSAAGPWLGGGKAVIAARKRFACAEVHTFLVSEEQSVLQAANAQYVGTGLTSATPVHAQLSVDALRVDGRAGSPPRGTPV